MSRTRQTTKRRTVNRRDSTAWDYQFSGDRYGNLRSQMAELKRRGRRGERAAMRQLTRKEIEGGEV